MTEITANLLRQLVHQPTADAAARILHVMTGCTIVTDTEGVSLVFKRQTGKAKLTHLVVKYNPGTDLYDLKAHRLNKRTCACPVVWNMTDVYAEDLKRISEEVTGLYFTL
jgi:hypothetical protein